MKYICWLTYSIIHTKQGADKNVIDVEYKIIQATERDRKEVSRNNRHMRKEIYIEKEER